MVDYNTHTCKNKYRHDQVVRQEDWKHGSCRDRLDVAEFGPCQEDSESTAGYLAMISNRGDMRSPPPTHAHLTQENRGQDEKVGS